MLTNNQNKSNSGPVLIKHGLLDMSLGVGAGHAHKNKQETSGSVTSLHCLKSLDFPIHTATRET